MRGWDKKQDSIRNIELNDDIIWSLFNYVFSDSCAKRNTYKFGLIKSILDCLFLVTTVSEGRYLSYANIFNHFARNYWNLVVKYDLRQMRRDGKSTYSAIESIFYKAVEENPILKMIEFDSIGESKKEEIVSEVTKKCKRNVIGALYENFDGAIYSFDLSGEGLILNNRVYEFMLRYKMELEKLNYYSWARFLEGINCDDVLVRVIDKLELATPHRDNLSVYREILRREFEENTCFYCGKKLQRGIHVDHFIPWSFVKDDKIWNFVLACPSCNARKNDKLPNESMIERIEIRNKKLICIQDKFIRTDMESYSEELLRRMWHYARLGGLKELS